ncbi:DUF4352 domain-containing protein [Aeromicrobium phragmitis]|uniref:DUF4352 domain-containing protein n=1 Tax=Aeromicrobium phragmitis TaxID=2478914 RepID=A0A3L8PMC6_9ACTN|nr:DUF4352 domain-containing protein [Aeromicrobium phragmitis]RLV56485.1 DUF4352 domain-containing protein [Aeromicrobium phragmitis]
MRTRSALTALAAASVLLLSACGGGDEEPSAEPTPSAEETTAEPTEEPAGEQQELEVDETITDDVMGHTITVMKLIRDFDAPDNRNIPERGGEWVLVEVDTQAGDKFSGGIQGGFRLVDADGNLAGPATTILDNAMAEAGLTPWEGVSAGEQGTGWIAFQVNNRSDAYQLEYKRGAASVIGSDEQIDEQIWTVDLPTA